MIISELSLFVEGVNKILRIKGYKEISLSEVDFRLSNNQEVLMKIISDTTRRENNKRLEDIVSKKNLAETLMENRLIEIEKERNDEKGWEPKLPIELVLKNIFRKIPRSL